MIPKNREPRTPGEVLDEEFLQPLTMTQQTLADRMKVSVNTVNQIVNGKRSITPETAISLAKVFKTTAQFWLNVQNRSDLWKAERAMNRSARRT